MRKSKYFFKIKRTIWMLAVFALVLITIYLITYNCEPVMGLSVEKANAIWSVIVNLSCGYIISLMFYLMLVFKTEYQTYCRRHTTSKRVYEYYLRIQTNIKEMLNIYNILEPSMGNNKDYSDVKHKKYSTCLFGERDMVECDKAMKYTASKVQMNIDKIEPFLGELSQLAIEVFVDIQMSYIFEHHNNKDETWFDGAVMFFMDRVETTSDKLQTLIDSGSSAVMNKEC